jgi:hypothetical protein
MNFVDSLHVTSHKQKKKKKVTRSSRDVTFSSADYKSIPSLGTNCKKEIQILKM